MTDRQFDAEILATLERYSASWYSDIDHIDAARIARGIPKRAEADLIESIRSNIDEAIFNRDGIRDRYERAQRDGLFDLKRVDDVSAETQEKWLAAVEMMKGDKGRCIAELKHWREYMTWAQEQQHSKPLPPIPPDPRLPPERDEEAPPF